MAERQTPVRSYLIVYAALMLLLGATAGLAFVDLGPWSSAATLGIAGLKALLVLLYFMHLRHSSRLIWVVAGAGFYWLAILLGLTFTDLLTRPWLSPRLTGGP